MQGLNSETIMVRSPWVLTPLLYREDLNVLRVRMFRGGQSNFLMDWRIP